MPAPTAASDPGRLAGAIAAGWSHLVRSFRSLEEHAPPLARSGVAGLLERRLPVPPDHLLDPWILVDYHRLGSHLRAGGDGDRLPVDLERLRQRILRPLPCGTVLAYGDTGGHVSHDDWEALIALLGEGGDFPADLVAPDPVTYVRFSGAVAACRILIRQVDPGLARSMDPLQGLLVLASPGPAALAAGFRFGGATAFFFRGGSIVDPRAEHTMVSLLDTLVHEYAHAELFVLAQDALLCLNGDEERYDVSVRPDPRPMNGILHSLYVMGRVVAFLDRLQAHGLPWRSDRGALLGDALALRQRLLGYGLSSLEAVRRHGRLTPLGSAVAEVSAARLAAPAPVPSA